MIALHIPNDCHIFLKYLLYSSSVHSFHCKLDFKDKRLLGDRGRGRKKNLAKRRQSRRQQLGQMWRNCRRDKRNKTGLHCAEEIEQLIISHKRKHNEIAPPPTVLTLHPCSTHIYTKIIHTHTPIFPKQLKRQRWSPHFRQIKLQFIFQLYPKLTLSTSSLSSLKGISQSQVCVRVERKRGEERKKKKKIWDVLLSKYYTWETLIQKKERGGGDRTGV